LSARQLTATIGHFDSVRDTLRTEEKCSGGILDRNKNPVVDGQNSRLRKTVIVRAKFDRDFLSLSLLRDETGIAISRLKKQEKSRYQKC
jgi:hypothetical protein